MLDQSGTVAPGDLAFRLFSLVWVPFVVGGQGYLGKHRESHRKRNPDECFETKQNDL